MRITNNVIYNSLLNDINKNRANLATSQRILATGKDVSIPSDAPVKFAKARTLEEINQRQTQYQDNIKLAIVQSRSAQDSFNSMLDSVTDIKVKAIQAANEGVMGEEEIDILQNYAAEAKETLRTIGNTRVLDRYIFAGSKTETVPFTADEDDNTVYNGNSDKLMLQVSDFSNFEISVSGDKLMGVYQMLDKFEDALANHDYDGMTGILDEVDDSISTLSNLASDVGSTINKMEYLYEQYEKANIENQGEVSRLTDTDYAEAFSNMQKYQISYQAAIEANQRLINTSLVNMLK